MNTFEPIYVMTDNTYLNVKKALAKGWVIGLEGCLFNPEDISKGRAANWRTFEFERRTILIPHWFEEVLYGR